MSRLLSLLSRYTKPLRRNVASRASRRPFTLGVERLERREVPAALSVSDVTVREGPANLGILDPSGAASVGINDIRGIAFDTGPSDAHYGDLFVTGMLSHSVARFDWASQTYQPFVEPNSGGLGDAYGIAVGPDGHVYVSDWKQNIVFRYDGATGAPLPAAGQTGAVFVAAGSGGVLNPRGILFGSDGNLYVCSVDSNVTGQILKYQGPAGSSPGAFLGVFTNINNGSAPTDLTFGPDGNLYVSLFNMHNPTVTAYGQINRYDGLTGAPIGTGVFVPLASGGLIQPRGLVFDTGGTNLYVALSVGGNNSTPNMPGTMSQVLRFQGPAGANPGAYVEAYITGGQSGLEGPVGLARDAAGNLYVGDRLTPNVTRFAPGSQATFTVSLDSPSASPVSVDYATANATAAAGSDYTVAAGTVVFAPGETSKTVVLPILDDLAGEPTETFEFNLSNALNATIADGQAVGTVLDNETKFFVVDSGPAQTYEYGSGGTSEEITVPHFSSNTAPRGVAATAAGTTVWVVDANKNVYVYNHAGVQQGSWTAGSLNAQAQVEGVATNGTDVWIVDAKQDKVFRYTGAASRLSGSQNAASSFSLNTANKNPKDVVTDGTSLWVIDDSTTDKVFKYSSTGTLLGSWTITGGGGSPTGITLDPTGASLDLWTVDNATDRVYQYAGARSLTTGSASASATFALAPGNTNPQGIADPPAPGMLLEQAAPPLAMDQPSVPAFRVAATNDAPLAAAIPSLPGRDAVFAMLVRESFPTPVANDVFAPAGASGGQKPVDPFPLAMTGNSPGFRFDLGGVGLMDGALAEGDSQTSAMDTDLFSVWQAEDEPVEE